MHLKRYRSSTVRDALAQAREELVPDALVLSTRIVSVRGVRGWLGGRGVELTAARDATVSSSRPSGRSADMPAAELGAGLERLTNFGAQRVPDDFERAAASATRGARDRRRCAYAGRRRMSATKPTMLTLAIRRLRPVTRSTRPLAISDVDREAPLCA
jgi:flagellar biosynthesis GTPase FlhF